MFRAILLCGSLIASEAQAARRAELVLRGGAVYTVDAARSWASAIAVAGGKIVYVGDDAGAAAFIDRRTRVIELGGRMVLPGFHDSHVHPVSGGLRLVRCRLGEAKTEEAIETAIRACANAARDRAWVIGGGWAPAAFGASGPSREELDELVPDRPAYFATEDGFTAWVNSRALAAAGLVLEDRSGVVRGGALDAIRSKMPPPAPEEYREGLRRFSAMANRAGITSVIDASTSEAMLEIYRAADRAGELTLRVRASQRIDPRRGAEQVAELVARRDRVRGRRLDARAAKIFVDGNPDQHTAALLEPYADRANERGALNIEPAALEAIVARLDAERFQIHLHACGDRAIRAALDAIEKTGSRDRRHQLAHLDLPDPADLPRFRRLGVAANLQLLWAAQDAETQESLEAALGAERARRLYPFARIFASGAVVVAGSDWPSPALDPLEAMQIALTRRPPEETVRLPQMIAAYTIAGAWIAGAEKSRGSIEVGKAADLIVLERNLFEVDAAELGRVRVSSTFLEGVEVYRSEPHGSK